MFRCFYAILREITNFVLTLADEICNLCEDGVRTPKHIGVILVLILY